MAAMDLDVSVRDDLGSVSVVSAMVVNRSDVTSTVLSALETSDIHAHLITCTPNRVSCHVLASNVGRAAQTLHDAFQLHTGEESGSREGRSGVCGFLRGDVDAGTDTGAQSHQAITAPSGGPDGTAPPGGITPPVQHGGTVPPTAPTQTDR